MTETLEQAQSAEVLAYQAKELSWFLNHDGYKRAVESTERRIIAEWRAAQDPLSREMAWHKLKAFETLRHEVVVASTRKPELVK